MDPFLSAFADETIKTAAFGKDDLMEPGSATGGRKPAFGKDDLMEPGSAPMPSARSVAGMSMQAGQHSNPAPAAVASHKPRSSGIPVSVDAARKTIEREPANRKARAAQGAAEQARMDAHSPAAPTGRPASTAGSAVSAPVAGISNAAGNISRGISGMAGKASAGIAKMDATSGAAEQAKLDASSPRPVSSPAPASAGGPASAVGGAASAPARGLSGLAQTAGQGFASMRSTARQAAPGGMAGYGDIVRARMAQGMRSSATTAAAPAGVQKVSHVVDPVLVGFVDELAKTAAVTDMIAKAMTPPGKVTDTIARVMAPRVEAADRVRK